MPEQIDKQPATTESTEAIHPQTRIGHVHLKVADLERAERFYREALGFTVTERYGSQAVFLSAGGYHHHVALNTWESAGGSPPPRGSTGLYHFAILYPNRRELARALARLQNHAVRIDGASDHGVSEAIYLHDPDGNGIELTADRDPSQWPRRDGKLTMRTLPLDMEALLKELD
ncbi:MAG: VOC family protein [Chloroflexota bacterium]